MVRFLLDGSRIGNNVGATRTPGIGGNRRSRRGLSAVPVGLGSDAGGPIGGEDAGMSAESRAWIDLYWLPLGAGGHSVRLNGRVFEAVAARLEGRSACDLYHSALVVQVPEGRFVVEQAPVRDDNGQERGVVAEGAVGSRWAGRFRILRYEVRRWGWGVIPDVDEAVESPQRLTDDPDVARRILDLVPHVPTAVWGRDELGAGEMWNSNSTTAWLIARCGLPAESINPPVGGRAPGWRAGLVVARRETMRGHVLATPRSATRLRVLHQASSWSDQERAGFPHRRSAGSPRRSRPAVPRLGQTRGGTSVDTDLVRRLADCERRRRQRTSHLRSRELVGWDADARRRTRPQ